MSTQSLTLPMQVSEALPPPKHKMPRKRRKVLQQIVDHPRYRELDDYTIWVFEVAILNGWSPPSFENNKRVVQIWRHLYLDEPLGSSGTPTPVKKK